MPQAPLFSTYAQSQGLLRGSVWFVNEATGNDNHGGTQMRPFKTLSRALIVAEPMDTILIESSIHTAAPVVVATSHINIIGLDAPSNNCRSRISVLGGSAPFSPLVSVTSQGCRFENLGTFHGGFTGATGSQVCWADSGGRNHYRNVQFLGGGDATTAALAGMRSLTVAGSGENLFEGCTIGLDTIARASNANASLELTGGTARNVFRGCLLQMLSSIAGNVHVKVGADGIDRYVLFDDCVFHNAINSTATSLTADMSVDAAAGGTVIVNGGISIGSGKVSAAGPVQIIGPVPIAGTSILSVTAA